MSEPLARTWKLLAKLGYTKSEGSAESIPLNDFKCYDIEDFSHLNNRRQWTPRYTSEDQSNEKSDLEICGLLHLQEPNLSDEVEEVSCDTSDSCCYDLEEGNQNSTNIAQEKMESDQSRSKKNAVSKLFNKLRSFKKHESNNSSIYNLEEQESPNAEPSQTHVKISYVPVAHSGPSRESYYATPKTSAASVDVPPDQSLLAKQHSILRRLDSTLNEATNIVGEFLQLYKLLSQSRRLPILSKPKMYQEGSKGEVISDYESEYEENWPELEYPDEGWLTAKDPIFWCLAPAHLEECVWLFRTAPTRQPTDSRGHPITLLEFYIRMDVTDLLNKLWRAPERIHDKLCIIWTHVKKRRNLSRENYLTHYFGPELDLLFDRDPDLPPSWEVTVPDHVRYLSIFFPEWLESVFV